MAFFLNPAAAGAMPNIAAGWALTVALKSDGTLWAWGYNDIGQLGDGTTNTRSSPEQIGTDNKWVSVAAGYDHTAALKSDGTLWAWGWNYYGQLGDGTTNSQSSPEQIGTDNKWVSVAPGYDHTVALKSDGTLWAWGYNGNGQLGDGTANSQSSPEQIGTDNKWVSVAAGFYHTAALKSDGTLWAWGYNGYGQLGDGTTNSRSSPEQIGTDNKWVSVAAGAYHTVALKSDGTLWAWGYNVYGQLGDGTTNSRSSPEQIGIDNKWVSVAAGFYHTVALKSDDTLWAWGYNGYGELGDATTNGHSIPEQIGTDNKWVSVAAGTAHTVALKSDDTLWAWGWNYYGQLGDGTTNSQNSPEQVGTGGFTTYTVTPSAGTGGSISPSTPQTVTYKGTTAFTATPNTGYQIASVTGCGGTLSGNTYTTGPITSNCTVSATFAAATIQTLAFAVNSGGGQYTDTSGNVYQSDTDYSGGTAASTTGAISGTKDPALYQTERYGNFSYNIPLANGNYSVTLKFAEIYWSAAGKRVFNVSMQGTRVITNLDIYAQVGKNAAYDVTIPAAVTNGTLNIVFTTVVDNAKVDAIEVTMQAGGSSIPMALGVVDNVVYQGNFPTSTASGLTHSSLIINGTSRDLLIYRPSGGQSQPLMIFFAGTGSTLASITSAYGYLSAFADSNNVILAVPVPRVMSYGDWDNHSAGQAYWETAVGDSISSAPSSDPDTNPDLLFTRAIIREASVAYGADLTRVYVNGFSSGALFSYFVAAILNDRIAAFAETGGGLVLCNTTAGYPTPCNPIALPAALGTVRSCTGAGWYPGLCVIPGAIPRPIAPASVLRVPPGFMEANDDDTTVPFAHTCNLANALPASNDDEVRIVHNNSGHAINSDYFANSWNFMKNFSTITSACTYTVLPTRQTFTSAGGTGSATVTTSTDCAWLSSNTLSWVTITSGSSGSGSGTVSYSVTANTSGAARTGNLTIAGQTFTIMQSATTN